MKNYGEIINNLFYLLGDLAHCLGVLSAKGHADSHAENFESMGCSDKGNKKAQ